MDNQKGVQMADLKEMVIHHQRNKIDRLERDVVNLEKKIKILVRRNADLSQSRHHLVNGPIKRVIEEWAADNGYKPYDTKIHNLIERLESI